MITGGVLLLAVIIDSLSRKSRASSRASLKPPDLTHFGPLHGNRVIPRRDDAVPLRSSMSDVDLAAGIGRRTQSTIYRDGASGREPRIPTRWHDLLTVAERAMTPEAWA